MKKIKNKQLKQVAGAGKTGDAATITAITSTSGAIGATVAGPVGAVVGAVVGSIAGNSLVANKKEVAEAVGTVASGYAHGHKDAGFTGMPMAMQKK